MFSNIIGNRSPHALDPQGLGVRASTDDFLDISCCTLLDIWMDFLRLQQLRVKDTTNHSSIETDGFLVEVLWIPNVAVC